MTFPVLIARLSIVRQQCAFCCCYYCCLFALTFSLFVYSFSTNVVDCVSIGSSLVFPWVCLFFFATSTQFGSECMCTCVYECLLFLSLVSTTTHSHSVNVFYCYLPYCYQYYLLVRLCVCVRMCAETHTTPPREWKKGRKKRKMYVVVVAICIYSHIHILTTVFECVSVCVHIVYVFHFSNDCIAPRIVRFIYGLHLGTFFTYDTHGSCFRCSFVINIFFLPLSLHRSKCIVFYFV